MKIPKNKFIINHKYNSSDNNNNNSNRKNGWSNNCISLMIFHMTTRTAAVTAAVMIFVQAIVSVNTMQNVAIQPETDITTTATTATTTILFDLSKNSVIVQQLQQLQQKQKQHEYQSTKTKSQQTPLQSPVPLNSFHLSHTTKPGTMAQPSPPLPNMRMTRSPATASMAMSSSSSSSSGSDVAGSSECKSLNGAWGDVDPNIFYVCDIQTKKPLQLRCPVGRGFFLGLGFSGCIPYEQWPACISSGHHEQVAVCDSAHMQQPWESVNPNKFYVCLRESIEPAILNCEPGKGFVHAIVTANGIHEDGGGGYSEILGCANWEKWRSYMHCNDYY